MAKLIVEDVWSPTDKPGVNTYYDRVLAKHGYKYSADTDHGRKYMHQLGQHSVLIKNPNSGFQLYKLHSQAGWMPPINGDTPGQLEELLSNEHKMDER